MSSLTFKPREANKVLLTPLPARTRKVIKKRFGLDVRQPMTLEAIGQIYRITRERVRQIEETGLQMIKRSASWRQSSPILEELKKVVDQHGGVVHEQEFLNEVAADPIVRNNVHFLLVLGDAFVRLRENELFHHRWTTDEKLADLVQRSVRNLAESLSNDDLLSETELLEAFLGNLAGGVRAEHAQENARRWVRISKEIGLNPVGEWGLLSSPKVKVRGIRDYAYLALRRHGSPMHFNEVAKTIREQFKVRANPATTHNELIKDGRFVLVGRGLYALTEWGYLRGTVQEVIAELLRRHGPLAKEEIIEKVLKERYVKGNTVLINLKNRKHFKQAKDGKFTLAD